MVNSLLKESLKNNLFINGLNVNTSDSKHLDGSVESFAVMPPKIQISSIAHTADNPIAGRGRKLISAHISWSG